MPDSLRTANDRCNTSRPERVAASGVGETGGQRSPFYHPQHISSRHWIFRNCRCLFTLRKSGVARTGGTAGTISSWNFFLFMVVATVHFLQFFLRKMYFLTLPAGLMFEKQKTDGPLTRVERKRVKPPSKKPRTTYGG